MSSDYRESLRKFQRRISSVHYKSKMWNDENLQMPEVLFNRKIINIACRSGYSPCLKDAYAAFSNWIQKDNNKLLSPNFRDYIVKYGVSYSKVQSDYDFVWNKYIDTPADDPIKEVLLMSFAYIKDSQIVKKYSFFNFLVQNIFLILIF